jgi:hypothetical protein
MLQLPFPCIQVFSIDGFRCFPDFPRWGGLDDELTDAISNLIHSTTLQTLDIQFLAHVPFSLFQGMGHLKRLDLNFAWPCWFEEDLVAPRDLGGVETVVDECIWYFWEPVRGMRFCMSI